MRLFYIRIPKNHTPSPVNALLIYEPHFKDIRKQTKVQNCNFNEGNKKKITKILTTDL